MLVVTWCATLRLAPLPLPSAHSTRTANPFGRGGRGGPAGKEQKDQFAANFQASRFPTAHAYVDKHSLYTISAGRKVHCRTSSWLNSQQPGFFTCELPEEARNDKNSLMLLPKGTHVLGQISHALVQGQDRLLAIFSEIRTDDEPEIKVKLSSPAADALGGAGIPVTVNDFFWQNFLATAVYAVLDSGPLLLVNALNSHGGNNSDVTNFTQITQPESTLAGRVLNDRLKRAPVGERALPADVVIFINQDIDCYDAIQVRLSRAHQWADR
jgi:type IV secretion system protein VirB10